MSNIRERKEANTKGFEKGITFIRKGNTSCYNE
jgi:hypothetical protein